MVPAIINRFSRFVFDADQIKGGCIKFGAFMPPVKPSVTVGLMALSVCDSASASETEIWQDGSYVEAMRNRTLLARADVSKDVLLVEGLAFVPDGKGFARHANLLGWHIDKPKRQQVAVNMAKAAALVMRP